MSEKRITEEMAQDTIRRSLPNIHRPRLRTESEARLAETEQKSRECYASLEMLTAQLQELATDLKDSDGVPQPEQTWDDTSMVHHVADARSKAGEGE